MAFIHGKNTYVSVNGTDISQFCSSSELGRSTDTHDVTGYGNMSKHFIGGLTDATFSCEGSYDNTSATGPRSVLLPIMNGDAVTIIRRGEGTVSGAPEDQFEAICTSYVETSPVADKVTWSADFQVTGDVLLNAQA